MNSWLNVWRLLLPALLAGCMLSQPTSADDTIHLADIEGDDHGAGEIVYPSRYDFQPGDLDILRVDAVSTPDGTRFSVLFRNPIRKPWDGYRDLGPEPLDSIARLGFYTFNVDIYIDRDRIPGSGNVNAMPGRGVTIDPRDAWEKAIILTPRPAVARSILEDDFEHRLEQQRRAEIGKVDAGFLASVRQQIVQELDETVYFPVDVRVTNREVHFTVPRNFLGSAASPDWSYVVLVTGASLYKRTYLKSPGTYNLMTMPVGIGRPLERFGLVTDADPGQPPVIDLVNPDPGYQKKALSDYDAVSSRLAQISGVVPSAVRVPVSSLSAGVDEAVTAPTEEAGAIPSEDTGVVPSAAEAQNEPGGRATIDHMLAPAVGEQYDVAERLRKLEALKQQNLITDEEYRKLRQKILSEI